MTEEAASSQRDDAVTVASVSGALRWFAAAAMAALAHAAVIWVAIHWSDFAAAPSAALDDAVLIDLEPAAAQPVPADPKPPEPPPADAAPPVQTPPAEPPAVEPAPQEPVQEPPPPLLHLEQEIVPPPKADAEAMLPPRPQDWPKPERPAQAKPPSPPVAVRHPPRPESERQTRPVRPSAAPSERASASAPSAADRANWQSAVAAHIDKFKRAPSNGATGVARVAFRIDAGGRVLSASIVASSGDATLDGEALGLVRRASPVPAPPRGSGGALSLVVPVRFSR